MRVISIFWMSKYERLLYFIGIYISFVWIVSKDYSWFKHLHLHHLTVSKLAIMAQPEWEIITNLGENGKYHLTDCFLRAFEYILLYRNVNAASWSETLGVWVALKEPLEKKTRASCDVKRCGFIGEKLDQILVTNLACNSPSPCQHPHLAWSYVNADIQLSPCCRLNTNHHYTLVVSSPAMLKLCVNMASSLAYNYNKKYIMWNNISQHSSVEAFPYDVSGTTCLFSRLGFP